MALSTLLAGPDDSDFFSALSPFRGLGPLLSSVSDAGLRPIPINVKEVNLHICEDKGYHVCSDLSSRASLVPMCRAMHRVCTKYI